MLTGSQYISWLLWLVSLGHGANILGVFTIPSVSHQIVYQPIWKELSLRGHQVTILSANPLKDPTLINLTEIDLSFTYQNLDKFKEMLTTNDREHHWLAMSNMLTSLVQVCKKIFLSEEVQKFIKDDNKSFDVILIEIVDPITLAFAAKFKCPIIGVASLGVPNPIHEAIGTPMHPVLHPDFYTPYHGGAVGLFEKIDAVLYDLYQRYIYNYIYFPEVTAIVKQHFGNDIPDLNSVQKNMSMLFLNTNPIIHGVRSYGPNVVEFGSGIHIKPSKPLPLALKSFLDNATEGVIYFSLGTNIQSVHLPKSKRTILIKTFEKLPYKVLWKFESDHLEGKPKNVKIINWSPQLEVLRHQNIKLFITQAGLQSTEEALLNGVPLLAIPFIADQHFNARSIEKLGVGLKLDFQTISEKELLSTILEITKNPMFKKNAVDVEKLIKDQPMTGLEKVVWWTEYVIRNRGAFHLRNPRADVTWSEFLILDVVVLLLLLLCAMSFVVYKISKTSFGFNQKLKKKSE